MKNDSSVANGAERGASAAAALPSAKRAPKRRTDNVPEKMTAHAVRLLTICRLCRGLGNRTMMIGGNAHTSCFAESYGFKGLSSLGAPDIGKLRLNDISGLTPKQQRYLFSAARLLPKSRALSKGK